MSRNLFYKRVKVNRFSGSGYIPRFKLRITKENLKGALNNDLVLFRVPDARDSEPKVVKIVERFKLNFVVEVLELLKQGIVVFFDDPQLPGKRDIYGTFSRVQVGHKLLVQLRSFPPDRIQGRLLEILGHKDNPNVEFNSLVLDLKLPNDFESRSIQQEIEQLKEKRESFLTNKESYKSLEDKYFFTIDGEKAKDFDDAICTEKTSDGFKLYIAIADVWGYLRHLPSIAEEANQRGTSIYLLNRVITMLPPILSEDLCSLREGERKNTICLSIEISGRAELKKSTLKIFPAFIRSKKRFTYEQLNRYMQGKERDFFEDEQLKLAVLNSYEVAKRFVEREQFGNQETLRISQDKLEYQTNQEEKIISLSRANEESSELISFEKVIEKYMVLANNLVGEWFKKHNIKTIYRVHKTPEQARVNNFLYEMQHFRCNAPIFLDVPDLTTTKLNRLLTIFKKHPSFQLIQHNFLLTLPKAEYSLFNIGHFGLNSQNYLHFTSPIRRLPDLLVHKALWMHFLAPKLYSNQERESSQESLEKLVYLSNLAEQRAITAERRFIARKLYQYLLTKYPNQEFEGVIMSKSECGYNIRIDNCYEGYIRRENCKSSKKLGDTIQLRKVEYSWDEFIER